MRRAQRQYVCPVCGRALPSDSWLRRCPNCGAKTLWQRPSEQVRSGFVLFNARLCGIIAGIQIGMITLLVSGYRIPLPYPVALGAAAMPVVGYLVAGVIARRVHVGSRHDYLVFLISINSGLLVALIAAILGLSGAGALLIIALGAGLASARLISGILPQNDEY